MGKVVNADGLVQLYHKTAAENAKVSAVRYDGQREVIEVDLGYAGLPAVADNQTIASEFVVIPAGVLIEEVELVVDTAFDSANDTATLNVGWVDASDRSSNPDTDAFVKAATVTELTTPGIYRSTAVGGSSPLDAAGIGVKTTTAKLITWEVDTQAFNAGVGKLRIYFSTPNKTSDTLGDVL